MFRKLAANLNKKYKEKKASRRAVPKAMFGCLLDLSCICEVLENWFPWAFRGSCLVYKKYHFF